MEPTEESPTLIERPGETSHYYGEAVHVLDDKVLTTLLARLRSPATGQPAFNDLVRGLYTSLVRRVLDHEYPVKAVSVSTRMQATAGDFGIWHGDVLDPETFSVVVDIARGGILPSQVCFDTLNLLLEPRAVRQDHLMMERTVDLSHTVTGAALNGSKIGGTVEGAFLIFPDPMGATGGSLGTAIRAYLSNHGRPRKIFTLNLIVTPEFIRSMMKLAQELRVEIIVYALALDRGMSSSERVFASVPGTFPTYPVCSGGQEYESGLNEIQYIIPGAGGFGELMNNSWV